MPDISSTPYGRTITRAIRQTAAEIESMFKPGCKVTIIVRHPDIPDGQIITTNDDLAGITGAIYATKWGV